jgi:hypothetical protein
MSIKWTTLNRLGRSGALRSSYLWLILVPIAARILEKAPDTVELSLFGSTATFTLLLPFSWKIFYLSAIFFTAASLAYSIKCPIIVREFDNYAQYQEDGRGFAFLMRNLDYIYKTRALPRDEMIKFSQQMESDFELDIENLKATASKYSNEKTIHKDYNQEESSKVPRTVRERLSEFFWHVRDISDLLHGKFVIFVAGLYLIGFVLISITLFQNFMYVVKQF